MKKIVAIIAVISTGWTAFTEGRCEDTGFGVQIIDVTGFTFRQDFSRRNAAAFALGWKKAGDQLHLTGSGQYLFLWQGHLKVGEEAMDTYVAPGMKVHTSGPVAEARLSAGVSWRVLKRSVEMYGELIPGMRIYPDTDLVISLALGARYFF